MTSVFDEYKRRVTILLVSLMNIKGEFLFVGFIHKCKNIL